MLKVVRVKSSTGGGSGFGFFFGFFSFFFLGSGLAVIVTRLPGTKVGNVVGAIDGSGAGLSSRVPVGETGVDRVRGSGEETEGLSCWMT
jgi:hypothetical protein